MEEKQVRSLGFSGSFSKPTSTSSISASKQRAYFTPITARVQQAQQQSAALLAPNAVHMQKRKTLTSAPTTPAINSNSNVEDGNNGSNNNTRPSSPTDTQVGSSFPSTAKTLKAKAMSTTTESIVTLKQKQKIAQIQKNIQICIEVIRATFVTTWIRVRNLDLSLRELVAVADYDATLGLPKHTQNEALYMMSVRKIAKEEVDSLLDVRTVIRQFPVVEWPWEAFEMLINALKGRDMMCECDTLHLMWHLNQLQSILRKTSLTGPTATSGAFKAASSVGGTPREPAEVSNTNTNTNTNYYNHNSSNSTPRGVVASKDGKEKDTKDKESKESKEKEIGALTASTRGIGGFATKEYSFRDMEEAELDADTVDRVNRKRAQARRTLKDNIEMILRQSQEDLLTSSRSGAMEPPMLGLLDDESSEEESVEDDNAAFFSERQKLVSISTNNNNNNNNNNNSSTIGNTSVNNGAATSRPNLITPASAKKSIEPGIITYRRQAFTAQRSSRLHTRLVRDAFKAEEGLDTERLTLSSQAHIRGVPKLWMLRSYDVTKEQEKKAKYEKMMMQQPLVETSFIDEISSPRFWLDPATKVYRLIPDHAGHPSTTGSPRTAKIKAKAKKPLIPSIQGDSSGNGNSMEHLKTVTNVKKPFKGLKVDVLNESNLPAELETPGTFESRINLRLE